MVYRMPRYSIGSTPRHYNVGGVVRAVTKPLSINRRIWRLIDTAAIVAPLVGKSSIDIRLASRSFRRRLTARNPQVPEHQSRDRSRLSSLRSHPPWRRCRREIDSANRSPSHIGPVSGMPKRKLENGDQRLAPQSHQSTRRGDGWVARIRARNTVASRQGPLSRDGDDRLRRRAPSAVDHIMRLPLSKPRRP
jgi:hypothetical protein